MHGRLPLSPSSLIPRLNAMPSPPLFDLTHHFNSPTFFNGH